MKENINEKRAENIVENGCAGGYIEQSVIDEMASFNLYDPNSEDGLHYHEKSPEELERMHREWEEDGFPKKSGAADESILVDRNNRFRSNTTLRQEENIENFGEELFLTLTPVEIDIDLNDINVDDVTNALQNLPQIIPNNDSDDAIGEAILDYVYDYCADTYVTTVNTSELSHIFNIDEEGIIRGIRYICEHVRPLSEFDLYFVEDILTVINRKLFQENSI